MLSAEKVFSRKKMPGEEELCAQSYRGDLSELLQAGNIVSRRHILDRTGPPSLPFGGCYSFYTHVIGWGRAHGGKVTPLVVAKQRLKSDVALSTDSITPGPRAVLCRHGVDKLSAVQVKA